MELADPTTFLASVLVAMDNLPEVLRDRLIAIAAAASSDEASAIRGALLDAAAREEPTDA